MSKYTMNELKLAISEILAEAKKKKEKADELKKRGAQIEAYGLYDEAFDFSSPLGAMNLYAQQGAVNWGPYTSGGPQIDSRFAQPSTSALREQDEQALRAVVREVIENGLVPADSAWAPLVERRRPQPQGAWESANHMFEAWYDKFRSSHQSSGGKKAKGFEKDKERGPVKKHGQPPKK